jgi:hydrogenase-4 component F
MGLITFAFGMGGPLANFAGLLHMTMHSLTKSAIFFAVGHVAQAKGTQRISDIRGLSVTHPSLAVGLGLGVLAIAGLPPFGIFMSEFLLLTTTFARQPGLALLAAFGLVVAFGALVLRLQGMLFGAPSEPSHTVKASSFPFALHLLLVLIAGLYLPTALAAWFQRAAEVMG